MSIPSRTNITRSICHGSIHIELAGSDLEGNNSECHLATTSERGEGGLQGGRIYWEDRGYNEYDQRVEDLVLLPPVAMLLLVESTREMASLIPTMG